MTNNQLLGAGVDPVLYELPLARIVMPDLCLNSWDDGGHLLVLPKRPLTDRVECNAAEAVELMAATMLAGMALYALMRVEKVNYQEMGNWGIGNPQASKLHIHIFGRAQEQTFQVRGESIRFFPQGHPFYKTLSRPLEQSKRLALQEFCQSSLHHKPVSDLLSMAQQLVGTE